MRNIRAAGVRKRSRSGPRWLVALGASVSLVAGLALVTPPTQAAIAQSQIVSSNPDDWTPNVLDGQVNSMATVDGITVAVGNFTQVEETGSSTVLDRKHIFAFDSTGHVLDYFNPVPTGDEILDVISAGDGDHVIVGGQFTNVDGLARTARVFKISVHTGQIDKTFKSPGINNRVKTLQLFGNTLYIGGYFTQVNGVPRTYLAALDATTGADTGLVNLTFSGLWNGGKGRIEEMTMRPDGSQLVVIGNFTQVNGQSRPQIAMVDVGNGPATLDSWATTGFAKTCSSHFESYVYDVDSSPDGSYFVVVTTGAYSGGPGAGTLCDAASRWEFGRTGSGQQPSWVEYSGGDTFVSVEATGTAIYVGGHFRWMNNPSASDKKGPGGVRRKGLAALDPRNGLPLTWNPTRDRGWGVWGFRATPDGLWMGSDTDVTANEPRSRIAYFPMVGGAAMPADDTGSLPGSTYLLGSSSDATAVRKIDFSGTSVTGDTSTSQTTFNPTTMRAAFMVDGKMYYARTDGVMARRTFNGTKFGGEALVDLYGLTNFSTEMKTMTSMFYDRDLGRLYFTLAGSNALYYRYFTTQSNTVGGLRFQVSDAVSGQNWSTVTGAYVAGGKLYVRDTSGNVRSMSWSNGAPSSAASTVSGPATDGVDWRGGLFFLKA